MRQTLGLFSSGSVDSYHGGTPDSSDPGADPNQGPLKSLQRPLVRGEHGASHAPLVKSDGLAPRAILTITVFLANDQLVASRIAGHERIRNLERRDVG
jgi:hypothetical protein